LGFEIKSAFPNLCSYQRFIALREKAIPVLILLHYAVLSSCDGISYVDSTTIKACHIKREKRHKTFKLWAKKSKGTMGWFYGFKLHIIVNSKGELLNAFFSAGNVDDRDGLREMCKNIFGDIVGDRGYIGRTYAKFNFIEGFFNSFIIYCVKSPCFNWYKFLPILYA
jgi:Transposase DDE domain